MSSKRAASPPPPAKRAAADGTPLIIAASSVSDDGQFDRTFYFKVPKAKVEDELIEVIVVSEADSNGTELTWTEAYLMLAFTVVDKGEEYADQTQRNLKGVLDDDDCALARQATIFEPKAATVTVNGQMLFRCI